MSYLAIVVGMAVLGAWVGVIQPSVIEHALVNAMVAVVLAIAAAQLDLGLGTGGEHGPRKPGAPPARARAGRSPEPSFRP